MPSTSIIAPLTLSINVLTTLQVTALAANLTIGNTPIDGIQNLKMSAFAIVLYSFCLTLVSQRLFQVINVEKAITTANAEPKEK